MQGWGLVSEGGILKLHRSWKVKSFTKGLEFFQLVANIAEAEGGVGTFCCALLIYSFPNITCTEFSRCICTYLHICIDICNVFMCSYMCLFKLIIFRAYLRSMQISCIGKSLVH